MFQFIIGLGIINIIFNFLWKWVFVLPISILFSILNLSNLGGRLIKTFGVYLMVSLIGLFTLTTLGESPGVLSLIFYPLIGAFVIFTGLAVGQYELHKEAYQKQDFALIEIFEKNVAFNIYIMISSIIFYVIVLFIPTVSANLLVEFIFSSIQWVYNIPVIGLIIGIGGVLFLINTIFHGILIFGTTLIGVKNVFKKEEITKEVIIKDIK
jgi:hypothetical protein